MHTIVSCVRTHKKKVGESLYISWARLDQSLMIFVILSSVA